MRWAAVGGLVVLACVVVACGGGGAAPAGPKFVLGEKLAKAGATMEVLPWNGIYGEVIVSLPEGAAPLPENSIKARFEGENGVKVEPGFANHPAFGAGEKAKVGVHSIDALTATITLDLP
jgi:hypothetical protein